MFTPTDRERVSAIALERARTDARIIGAAVTGSAAQAREDRWSDIDLFLGIADGIRINTIVSEWSEWIYAEFNAIHHFDVRSGATVYRVFLLAECLELDVAFAPAADFGPLGPQFRVVFGTPVARRHNSSVDLDDLIGRGWHHLLHAHACIERGRSWQAEYWISAVRDQTLALACVRFGKRTDYAKGAHHLPSEITAPLQGALVRTLDTDELRRALQVAVRSFLFEVRAMKPDLAQRLNEPLIEMSEKFSS
jgi:hypothetical protein